MLLPWYFKFQSFGVLAIQLARAWGVKVFTTTGSEEDSQMMRTMSLDVERILDGHQFMRNSIKDETGGLGVDCIVDHGGNFLGLKLCFPFSIESSAKVNLIVTKDFKRGGA